MNVLIIGAGAVGLALGASLYDAGASVRFWPRSSSGPEAPAAHPIEHEGIARSGLFGEVRVPPGAAAVWRTPEDWRGARLDYVLVCTKTTANVEVADLLASRWHDLAGEPRVVLCQNGWGSAERFAARLPREQIDNARIITGFRRTAPCRVSATVHADAIHLGNLFGAPTTPLAPLAEAIDRGGIPCRVSPDIERDLWAKLLYNCLLNPLGALTGVPYGALGERAETRAVMEAVAREVFEVLAASGRSTHWQSADAYLETFYADLLPPTAEHESSMLQDLEAGRPTEIDALCGAVARLGGPLGVETPTNTALTLLVHAAEARGGAGPTLGGA
jgi:2-dehydropantoate 2-reductase